MVAMFTRLRTQEEVEILLADVLILIDRAAKGRMTLEELKRKAFQRCAERGMSTATLAFCGSAYELPPHHVV